MSSAKCKPFSWGDLAEHAAIVRERVKKWPLWKQQVSVDRSPKCQKNSKRTKPSE